MEIKVFSLTIFILSITTCFTEEVNNVGKDINSNNKSNSVKYFEKENDLIMNSFTKEFLEKRNVDAEQLVDAIFIKELLMYSLTEGENVVEKQNFRLFNDLVDTMILEIPSEIKLSKLGDYTDRKHYVKAVRILNKRDSTKTQEKNDL